MVANARHCLTDVDLLLLDVVEVLLVGCLLFVDGVAHLLEDLFVLDQHLVLLPAGCGHLLESVEGPVHYLQNHLTQESVLLGETGKFQGVGVQEGLQKEGKSVLVVRVAVHVLLLKATHEGWRTSDLVQVP